MDEALLSNWNSVVGKTDTVYVLGDFAFYKTDEDFKHIQTIFNSLHGEKHLVVGNHDKPRTLSSLKWAEICNYKKLSTGKQQIILSHYRFAEWDNAFRGSIHLHGHEHNLKPSKSPYKVFDVGVDACKFTPVSLDTILEWSEKRVSMEFYDKASVPYNPL